MNLDIIELKSKRYEELTEMMQNPSLYTNPEAARDCL